MRSPTDDIDVVRFGLCADCRHARRIRSGKGSEFLLCGRGAEDPAYTRYPPLPVVRCPGYERGEAGDP